MIKWYQKHKILFFIVVGICTVLFSSMASAYNDVDRLNGVCVNEQNGQIALSYYTSDAAMAVLEVYRYFKQIRQVLVGVTVQHHDAS